MRLRDERYFDSVVAESWVPRQYKVGPIHFFGDDIEDRWHTELNIGIHIDLIVYCSRFVDFT